MEKYLAIVVGLLVGALLYVALLVPHPRGTLGPLGQSLSSTVNLNANPIVINQSPGGRIDQFDAQIEGIIQRRQNVVLDGWCASACTMILAVPTLCATDRAMLGFHQGYTIGPWGQHIPMPSGTAEMASHWRPYVKQWLKRHGGLTLDIKWMGPQDIFRMVPRCA